MANSPTRKPNKRLSQLVLEIEKAHNVFLGHLRTTVEHAIKAGELLSEAKELVPHGAWLNWLEENTSVEPRQAQRYMKVFDGRELLPKTTSTTYLTIERALELLDPEEDPEEDEEGTPFHIPPHRIETLRPEQTMTIAYREKPLYSLVDEPHEPHEPRETINLSAVRDDLEIREREEVRRAVSTGAVGERFAELIEAWNRASAEDRAAFWSLSKWIGVGPIKLDEKNEKKAQH